jgi:hypothetical protein
VILFTQTTTFAFLFIVFRALSVILFLPAARATSDIICRSRGWMSDDIYKQFT